MSAWDQLEIISPGGDITFHDLDPRKGVINIGRHPENDVVIDSPNVAPFHAVLDYGQKPCRITLLGEGGETMLRGQPLSLNIPVELHDWDTIEIDGYAIILLEGMGTLSPVPTEQPPIPVSGVQPPISGISRGERALVARPSAEMAVAPPLQMPPRLSARPPDQSDDAIIVELSEREWMVNVDQAATCQVTITNGGDIVAAFAVHVEGIAEDWVTLLPPQVNLNEGDRATVTISITPPRQSSSHAGIHHLAVVVTSPNYPGRSSRRGATLDIAPYYEFAVGELSPKQQTVGGRRPSGDVVVHIANKGNSEVALRLEAMDDARALSFEFEVPGETSTLARQAEIRLPPEETFAVPARITPTSPPLVGLRKRNHSFTITASLLEGALTPRSLLGQLSVRPLIGPWLLLLFSLLLVTLVVLIFRPRILDFQIEPEIILAGEPVALRWRASLFSTYLRIEADTDVFILEEPEDQMVLNPGDRLYPEYDQTYYLYADNVLSELFSFLSPTPGEASILVDPVFPEVRLFSSDRPSVVLGESVTLRWEVLNADEVILSVDGNPQTLQPTEHIGERRDTPVETRTYVYELQAVNRYGSRNAEPLHIIVEEPTPTPLPQPVIQRFTAFPLSVTEGQTVTLEWEVAYATKVRLSSSNTGWSQEYASLSGIEIQQPPATTNFVLTAIYEAENRSKSRESAVIVQVNPKPTPTQEPQVPEIEDFRVVPNTVVRGDGQSIQLVWSVTGDTTDIGVSGPTLSLVSNLAKTGSIPVSADTTTFFILTAHNGDLSTSQMVELTVEEPPPPPPPPPIIDYFVLDESSPNVTRQSVNTATSTINYEVSGGTTVNFEWSARNVSNVALRVGDTDLGDYPPSGGTPRLIVSSGQYRLGAENASGPRYAYIYIALEPVIPPPPPYNDGQQSGPNQPLTVTWQFNPGGYTGQIAGFRIYRADTPFTDCADFGLVGQVGSLPPYEWPEPSLGCDWGYYVSAVYTDEYGQTQETECDLALVWYSYPCR